MKLSPVAEAMIKDHEGLRLKAYLCPAGRWTIGWGHTKGVHEGMTCTEAQAQRWFDEDVAEAADAIQSRLKVQTNTNQMSALVSLVFNIGAGNFNKSSVLAAHNRGDFPAAGRAFNLWVKITDPKTKKLVVSPGLVSRRAKEAALYLTAVSEADKTPTPQVVAAPVPAMRSPTAIGSAVTTGAGSIAVVSQAASAVQDIAYQTKTTWEIIKELSPIVLGVIAMAVICYVVYRRFKRSQEGWL